MEALPIPPVESGAGLAPLPAPSLIQRILSDRDAVLAEIARGAAPALGRTFAISILLTVMGGLALGASRGALQALSAAAKAPLITLGTLVVSLPAFYIFAALSGSKIGPRQTVRFMAVGFALRAAILAGLAPLLLFFSCVGSPYGFLLFLAGLVFGLAELGFLRCVSAGVRALRDETGDALSLALTRGWMVVYVAVSCQMTWSLRPLIGHPDEALTVLGGHGNMYSYFFQNVGRFFSQ